MIKIDFEQKLGEYVEKITGRTVSFRPLDVSLPLFLNRYSFVQGTVLDVDFVFAFEKEAVLMPKEYSRHLERLREKFKLPVVFVFESLPLVRRNALVKMQVPFVVSGMQLFLPPLASLVEKNVVSAKKVTRFLPLTQLLVLKELLKGSVDGMSIKDVMSEFGYSAVTGKKAFDELVGMDLAEVTAEWPGRLRLLVHGRELWDRALPALRSPVRREWLSRTFPPTVVGAGLSALSRRTTLADDQLPTVACEPKGGRGEDETPYREEACCKVQEWRYKPLLFGAKEVDPFSLWLSLRDVRDPRVVGALEDMMEEVWKNR